MYIRAEDNNLITIGVRLNAEELAALNKLKKRYRCGTSALIRHMLVTEAANKVKR